jgi:hypothetical protein
MQFSIKRPGWIKTPGVGVITRRELAASKKRIIRFGDFGQYPVLKSKPRALGGVDSAFKTDVDRLIRDNAELLRRLAK